jgi:hypothetical protein
MVAAMEDHPLMRVGEFLQWWREQQPHEITPDGWCAAHSTEDGPVYCVATAPNPQPKT